METKIHNTIEEAFGAPIFNIHCFGKLVINPFYTIHTAFINYCYVVIYEKKDGFSCAIIS